MARVSNLKPRARFHGKIRGYSSRTVFYVKDIRPSLDLENHSLIVVLTNSGREKILRLPDSMKITIIPKGTNTKKARKTPGPKCSCYNHMGTKKILYPSEDAALKAIVRRHLRYGGHRIYECPKVPGKYHVTSRVDSNT